MRRLVQTAALLMVLTATGLVARSAPARWTRVTSANFTLVGDASEREIRQVALQFEQFRETMGRLLPAARVPAQTPVLVYVFATDKSYRPYKPLYQGKPMDAAGYCISATDAAFITLAVERGELAFPIIFHEYAHLLLRSALKAAPPWLNEGLAEYYSTFHLSADGKQAQIGRPIERHVLLLREHTIPLTQLLAVDRQSPLYNESDRRTIFYAESWAWVHFLLMGDPPRTRQLMTLVDGVMAGTPVDQAFRTAFGADPEAVQAELFQYVQRAAYRSVLLTLDAKVSPDQQMKASALADAEVEAALCDLLVQMNRLDEAEPRLSAVTKLEPTLAQAHTSMGVLRIRQKRPQDALACFREASSLDPTGPAGQRARTWLRMLDPRGATRTEPAPAAARDTPPARGVEPPDRPERTNQRPATPAPTVSNAEPLVEPLLRAMNEGEKRAGGTLEEIECRRTDIVLRVRSGERLIRVTAKGFDDVQFISYRDDLKGSVSCGPRNPPDPVYVTWRPGRAADAKLSPPIDGQVVAIEFLPKQSGTS